jgi:flagella basal body P-ring formation protein FlgA
MRAILLVVGLLFSGTNSAVAQGDRLKQAVEEFIRQHYHGTSEEVRLEFRTVPELGTAVPSGADLRVQPTGGSLRGTLILPVELVVEGSVQRRYLVTVRVRTFGDALAAKTMIPKEAPLSADVVEPQRIETTRFSGEQIGAVEELVGMRAARIIMPGTILTRAMVEQQPLVIRSAAVDLEVRSRAVVIVTKAIAREDGRPGETIEVERIGSRERMRATVVGPARVRCEIQ